MANFDPSVISQIGANMPNIPAAQQRARSDALTMRNLLDTDQLNQLKLSEAKGQEQREQSTRNILAQSDYSTPQGVTATAEKLSRAGLGPEAMDFTRTAQGVQSGRNALSLQQYQLLGQQNDLIGTAAQGLMGQYQTLVQGGTSPALASMIMQSKYQDAIKALSQQKLADGTPALDRPHLDAIATHPTFDPNFLGTVVMNSAKGRAILKQQMDVQKGRADIANTEARTRALDEGKLVPVQDPSDPSRVIYVPSARAAGQTVGKTSSGFGIQQPTTQAGKDIQRSISELGDRISYGQIRMLNFDSIATDPKYKGLSADEIAQDIVNNTQHTAAAQQVRIAFDKGKQGDTVRSLNVAIQHLGVLSRLGTSLRNTDARSVNAFYQGLGTQFGVAAPTNFDLAKDIVGDEVVKSVLSAGAGTGRDRSQLQESFSKASSPEQLAGVVQTAESLMTGQLTGLRDQFVSGVSGLTSPTAARKEFEGKLAPATRARLEGAATSSSAAAPLRVRSQSQYDSLPRGAKYIGPDGKTRTKQ